MQDPKEIEEAYRTMDPWSYKSNPDDLLRKQFIISVCNRFAPERGFDRALDLGCGEGWITQDLPAHALHGYELSARAKERFPIGVTREDVPAGLFDLVVTTGTLYSHYDYRLFFHLMQQHSKSIIVTSNIKSWERPELGDMEWVKSCLGAREIYSMEFDYREFKQKLRVFKK
jgi:hypothetical protein